MNIWAGVVFDADGTLLDSWPAHAQFLRDMSRAHDYKLTLPETDNIKNWRKYAGNPMAKVLQNCGFAERAVLEILKRYEDEFAENYEVKPFEGIEEMIDSFEKAKIPVYIASLNTERNVRRGLGRKLSKRFSAIYGLESINKHNAQRNKADLIFQEIVGFYGQGISPTQFCYVGDSESDYWAAYDSGTRFLGVSYGWDLRKGDETRIRKQGFVHPIMLASSPQEIADMLLKRDLKFQMPYKE